MTTELKRLGGNSPSFFFVVFTSPIIEQERRFAMGKRLENWIVAALVCLVAVKINLPLVLMLIIVYFVLR